MTELRIKRTEDVSEEKAIEFVKEQAVNIRHGSRTLCDHLMGTYELLKDWGCNKPTRLAGLYHSIYGTNVFHRSLTESMGIDRLDIIGKIGVEADMLVNIFKDLNGTTRRSVALDNALNLEKDIQLSLVYITLANGYEQHPNKEYQEFLDKIVELDGHHISL